MNHLTLILVLLSLVSITTAEEVVNDAAITTHQEAAAQLADRQDELSADVQQLAIEQTIPQVAELFHEVEKIMDEATDRLEEFDTGGSTIAAQTEVIEKIHAAAKEKQKQQGGGQAGGAIMDMMERMMGKSPDPDKEDKGQDAASSNQDDEGAKTPSEAAFSPNADPASGKIEVRRVPKSSGRAGRDLPEEFKKMLDAYNRGMEKNQK